MLRSYDNKVILSIVSANELKSGAASSLSIRTLGATKNLLNEGSGVKIEYVNLNRYLSFCEFMKDPYEIMHETYWSIVFNN